MKPEEKELYESCVAYAIKERKISAAMLQRHFSIGYGRAARMLDLMEAHGVIGPQYKHFRREVLI